MSLDYLTCAIRLSSISKNKDLTLRPLPKIAQWTGRYPDGLIDDVAKERM